MTGPDGGPDGWRPDHVFQVFRLAAGRIVDIRGYPERDPAVQVAAVRG